MRILAASDLHGLLPRADELPAADVLVLAGDLCPGRRLHDQSRWVRDVFAPWVDALPVRCVIATWGNHDFIGHALHVPVPKVRWLVDDGCVIDGVTFWGSPWSFPFFDWTFMLPETELAKRWARIPAATDVVITHSPPFGFGDRTVDGRHEGSPSLTTRLRVVRPRLAVWGHIHEAQGTWEEAGGTWANVAVLNEKYRVTRAPTLFELT